ncbi:MAG: SAM-dependent methyltransferase [Thermonemataceae bacterium]
MDKKPYIGKVYLIPTLLAPNTHDKVLTVQVEEMIQQIKYFFVENVRTARRFISSLKLGIVIENLHFIELHKKTTIADIQKEAQIVFKGQDVGILSEAGCPAIADPGHLLVAWAHKRDVQVIPLIGASSILLALMASGFNGQQFVFHGYLPIKANERTKALQQIEKEAYKKKQTQIFMETPFRNNQLFNSLLKTCSASTKLCIASNLTSQQEFIKTRTINDWKKQLPDLHKQPTLFLLYP